ncbi:unnamed protein product, partial [Brenthis ino]
MDSDEENDLQPQWKGVPGTIILINAIENSKHSNFAIAHVATCRLIRQYMRSSSSQNVGVFVFGIDLNNSNSNFDTKAVMEIIPLSIPTVDDYKKLKSFDISSYNEAKEFKLADVLWHCSKVFSNFKKTLSSKRVIMLTQLDILPILTDQEPTLNRARDLVDANIDLTILNVSEQECENDCLFYEKLLKISNKGMDFIFPEPIWDSFQIEKLMYQESHRNLAVARLNFEMGENFIIGVGVYSLLSSQKYQKNVNLDRETNAILSSATKTLKISVEDNNDDDEEQQQNKQKEVPLLKSEILYYQEFGGERIQFTDSEMTKIKNPFGPPMLKLLGFKSVSSISKEKCFLKSSYFLFPNESIIEGSTVAFKALHKACSEMQMAAFCVLCTRVNAKPINVALIPNSKPLNINVDIGFDVVSIPFIENVRDLNINVDDDNESSNIEDAHKSLMKDIIKTISMDYQADMFEDPKKQSKYRALEAIALGDDEDDMEPFIDTTKPNSDKFADIKDDLFEELFGPFGAVFKRTASKMPFEDAKKQKLEDIDENLLSTRIQEKTVNKYTVQQLKDVLKSKDIKGLPALTGLKKQDLVELVYKHCI